MATTFHKMHGAGNDFVLLDLRNQTFEPDASWVRAMGDRHTGIGFDQLLVLRTATRPDVEARVEFWNNDGSQAEQCGNGMRCIGLYLSRHGDGGNRALTVAAPVSDIILQCLGGDQVRVDMGVPQFNPDKLPFTGDNTLHEGWFQQQTERGKVTLGLVSMGNPHAVIEVEDISLAPLESLGKTLQNDRCFPESCNVGFVQVVTGSHLKLRVLERGAGETLACGSGACAAAAWFNRLGRTQNKVRVEQAGGSLTVESQEGSATVLLTGPARHVFEGMFE